MHLLMVGLELFMRIWGLRMGMDFRGLRATGLVSMMRCRSVRVRLRSKVLDGEHNSGCGEDAGQDGCLVEFHGIGLMSRLLRQ